MAIIQSSPIETAARSERNWLFVLAGWAVTSAIVAALLTIVLYKKTGVYQQAVQKAADAGIAQARSAASVADARAAEANAQAAKANEGLGKSNLEIARLTNEAAEANKQIAIAKADAARAKEGIANAEARSLEASVEVGKLRVTVANAETRRAQAEKALLELQEQVRPRRLTVSQRSKLLDALKSSPHKGAIEIGCPISNAEACAFAEEFRDVLKEAGWTVTAFGLLPLPRQAVGIILELRDATKAPLRAGVLAEAIQSIGVEGPLTVAPNPSVDEQRVSLIIGAKP